MLNKERHKVKHLVLKAMAVFITFCYIMEPAHDELRYVFHFISHNLQAPSYVLQHDTDVNYQDFAKPQNSLTNHNHEVLDFIDRIIDSSSEKDEHQGQPSNEFSRTKKIIVYYEYDLVENSFSSIYRRDNFKVISYLKNKGHSVQLYRPPQLFSNVY